MKIKNLKVNINKEEVFRQINCHTESDLYEEISEEYEEILDQMYALCDPVCLIEYSDLKNQSFIKHDNENYGAYLVLYSIGRGISEFSNKCFQQGDYVKGMLSDAMADSALFSMERAIEPYLKMMCEQMHVGIANRLEAPHDVPMEIQKYVHEKTKAKELCDFDISSGYMIDPIKSNVLIYLLTNDQHLFAIEHNCRKCKNYSCIHRNVQDLILKVYNDSECFELVIKEEQSILDSLIKHDQSFSSICGGNGKCGKCKIKILQGEIPATDFDRHFFSDTELEEGMRLACKAYPTDEIIFKVCFKNEENFQVITENFSQEMKQFSVTENLGIAIDIGTTTIALQLIELDKNNIIKTFTTINHQRKYGADVISRIKASGEGKKKILSQSVISDLLTGIEYLIADITTEIKTVVISGNTTMIHILMEYDCEGLGKYPFIPENTEYIETSFEEIFHSKVLSAKVKILPAISAFVGGDIVSGLYACDIAMSDKYSMLIDLGTNGEIALGNCEKILVTSTAAGPAFEGGNITHGIGSIEGAISNVSIKNTKAEIITIANKIPVGICGTGVIETVAELVKEGLVDETGCLDEEWFEDGFFLAKSMDGKDITFSQKDVREIQLAKAAVRAGIETLFLRYGISKDQIYKVYIAGGFGYKLDCTKAIEIGMIPQEFSGKIEAVGNASLQGAVKILVDDQGYEKLQIIKRISEEINLSADKDFNQLYMEYMYFD